MSALWSFARERHGQTVVEFALSVTLLLVIVLGLFDLGRAVWYSNTLSLATREGARFAIVNGSECRPGCTTSTAQPAIQDDVKTVVQRYLIGVNSTVTVTVGWPDGNAPGNRVAVTATTVYTPIASRYFLGGALNMTLEGGTTMVIRN